MCLNTAGKAAYQCWSEIPMHFPYIQLDKFIVMPNHVHGIIFICDCRGAISCAHKLGNIIRGYKIGVTKWLRNILGIHNVWQRNYWEHIVRNEHELMQIREYICNNPLNWELEEAH